MRKIAVWIAILIGCVALFFAGSALVLFLAPGVEIFGIRYVASGLSDYTFNDNFEHFEGDIYIETYGVPITIEYSEYASYLLTYHQDFVGFTKSKYDKAKVICSYDNHNLNIKVNEMVKWLYAQELGADYKFHLRLPSQALNKSIFINSESSNVNIKISPNVGDIHMSDLSIVTKGDFSLNGKIVADDFKLHTTKTITIDDQITCHNANLKSSGGGINVTKALAGNLVAETSVGDIKFVSCKTLTAKTGSGDIKSYNSGLNSVLGKVNISTRSGFVELGNISYDNTLSAEERIAEINSNSGEVNVSTLYHGTINNERGKIVVGEAEKLVINANVGSVTVKTIYDSIIVNGRNGEIKLGQSGTINNVKVQTTSGKISVLNTKGVVNIKSSSNAVNFANISSTDITLYSAKNLSATGLRGEVQVYVNGDAKLQFSEVSGNVNVSTGGKTDKVEIDATCIQYSDVDYKIESTKGTKAKIYAGEVVLAEKTKIESNVVEGHNLIEVKTSYAKIILKLGNTNG